MKSLSPLGPRPLSLVPHDPDSSYRHQCVPNLFPVPDFPAKFLAKLKNRFLHLPLHLFHLLAHREDHLDARKVDAEFPGQSQDHFELLDVFFGIEARVSPTPLRLDESLTLIEPQGLRMDAEHLRYHTDHKQSLFTSRHEPLQLIRIRIVEVKDKKHPSCCFA